MHWRVLMVNDPASPPIGALDQEEYDALTGRQRVAVDRLLDEVNDGKVHPASSAFDLTPHQLADEYGLPGDDPEEAWA